MGMTHFVVVVESYACVYLEQIVIDAKTQALFGQLDGDKAAALLC